MTQKNVPNTRLLYSGESLETYLIIKRKLGEHNIVFFEHSRQSENFLSFLYRLVIIGVGSLGMSSERRMTYTIYVNENDYCKAKEIISH